MTGSRDLSFRYATLDTHPFAAFWLSSYRPTNSSKCGAAIGVLGINDGGLASEISNPTRTQRPALS